MLLVTNRTSQAVESTETFVDLLCDLLTVLNREIPNISGVSSLEIESMRQTKRIHPYAKYTWETGGYKRYTNPDVVACINALSMYSELVS